MEYKKCRKRFTRGVNKIKQHIAWQLGNIKGYEKSTTEDMAICSVALQEPRKKKEKQKEENKMRQEVRISKERECEKPKFATVG